MQLTTPKTGVAQPTQQTFANAAVVTKSDATVVAFTALYVGGLGDVKVDTPNQTAVLFTAVPAGTLLPVQVTKVYSTGTTATNMVGLS